MVDVVDMRAEEESCVLQALRGDQVQQTVPAHRINLPSTTHMTCYTSMLDRASLLKNVWHSGKALAPRMWRHTFKYRQSMMHFVWTKVSDSVLNGHWDSN